MLFCAVASTYCSNQLSRNSFVLLEPLKRKLVEDPLSNQTLPSRQALLYTLDGNNVFKIIFPVSSKHLHKVTHYKDYKAHCQ